jgi:hypothetical protein
MQAEGLLHNGESAGWIWWLLIWYPVHGTFRYFQILESD